MWALAARMRLAADHATIGSMKDKPISPELDKIEMLPDAWERTERAVRAGAKLGPMHQQPKGAPKPSVVKQPRKR